VEDQLHVTDEKWAAWRKEAQQHAAQRRNTPTSRYPALLQAALQRQQLKQQQGAKRPRLAGNRAADEATAAAERRQQDPAAVRVQLVHQMRYLSLKKAALLALLQAEQQEQEQEQQLELEARVRRLKLPEVQAQLLDVRWSTEQLTRASGTAVDTAQDIAAAKKKAKAHKQQQRQQQGHGLSRRTHAQQHCLLARWLQAAAGQVSVPCVMLP